MLSNTQLLDASALNVHTPPAVPRMLRPFSHKSPCRPQEHANVIKFMEAVAALPGVSEYLATRPDAVDIGVAPMLRPKAAP